MLMAMAAASLQVLAGDREVLLGIGVSSPVVAADWHGAGYPSRPLAQMREFLAALELLREVGPMAQSSANRSGSPPAVTMADARAQLGEAVLVYLDGGPSSDPMPSTIVHLTCTEPRILREGAVPATAVSEAVGREVAVAS